MAYKITNNLGHIQSSIDEFALQIDVSTRNLIHYVLPYYHGDMQLILFNPSEDLNYIRIQFHENCDRHIPPVVIMLEGKETMAIKLSEEIGTVLRSGWAEVISAEIIFGGAWTNKEYLPLNRIDYYL